MCAKKAVIVIRHGDKDDDKNGVLGSNPDTFKNLPDNNYYKDTLIRPGTTDTPVSIYYTALTKLGYTEGKSFGITVPQLIKDQGLADVTHAFIVNPSPDGANGNTYITSYQLLKVLAKDGSFAFEFYGEAVEINGKLDLKNYNGSILVAGTAEVLAEEGEKKGTDDEGNGEDSVLYYLNQKYVGKGKKLQRGINIDVYSYEDGLQKFAQDPNNQTYHKI